jgi:hypothetical protein
MSATIAANEDRMTTAIRLVIMPVALSLWIVTGAGCGKPDGLRSTKSATSAGSAAESVDFANADAVDPSIRVSEAEARQFAERFGDAVNRADTDGVAELFDWDEMGRRATDGIELSDAALKGFRQGLQGANANQLFRRITEQIEQGGSYDFLRVRIGRGGRRLLFRVTSAEGMLNYHDIVVYRAGSGELMAADLHVAATGELLSETFRRSLLHIVAQENPTILQRLTGSQADYVKFLPQVSQLTTHIRENQYQEALADYDQLPASLQREKSILILRIAAAQNVSEAEYQAALKTLVEYHPNDASVGFYMIDAAQQGGDMEGALRAVNRLDKAVGGDPYLNVVRASLFVEKQDHTKARELLAKVEAWNPRLVQTQWVYVSIALAEQEFDEVVRRLRIVTDELGGGVADLTTIPEYAEFVKSPQYEAWMKSGNPSP